MMVVVNPKYRGAKVVDAVVVVSAEARTGMCAATASLSDCNRP